MPVWKPIVGQSFQPEEFADYCQSLHFTNWRPSFIVLHNTYIPDLPGKPNGFSKSDMQGFVEYYRDEMHWSAGPHLFVDDHQIWVFTPLTTTGVHSPSWNSVAWGVEMLGNYDKDAFDAGRGFSVQQNAVAALSTLFNTLGIEANAQTLRLHKEDPKTTHKNCPGAHVSKQVVLDKINSALIAGNDGEHALSLPVV